MIIVDVYYPYLGTTYDFSLDETTRITTVIEEIAATISMQERWITPVDTKQLSLYSNEFKRRLNGGKTLSAEGITTGHRLILC